MQICVSLHLHFWGFFGEKGLFFPSLFAYFVLFGFVCFYFTLFYFCCLLNVYLFSKKGEKESVNLGG